MVSAHRFPGPTFCSGVSFFSPLIGVVRGRNQSCAVLHLVSLKIRKWTCWITPPSPGRANQLLCFFTLSSLYPPFFPAKSFIPRLIQEWNGAQARLVNGVLWAIRLLPYLGLFLWIFLREAAEITNYFQPWGEVIGGSPSVQTALTVEHQQAPHLSGQLPNGMESQMLTRELNLHSPSSLIGAGTKTMEVSAPCPPWKSQAIFFFSPLCRNSAIQNV